MQVFNPTFVIALMGVDGSGKSTLVKHLNKKLKKKYLKIKKLHLRPYFFLTDTSTVNSNPHNQKKSTVFISLLRLLSWLISYKIFFLKNKKKKFIFSTDTHMIFLLIRHATNTIYIKS